MQKYAQELEQVRVSALIPAARNARTHSETQIGQIAQSIREFGFTNPVLIDAENGIIAGHGRVLGARLLGMETVPAIRIEYMTEAQKRAYVIADNKLALNAGWDDELLALELGDLKAEGFDLLLTGFDADELARLRIGTEGEFEGLTDEDDAPAVQDRFVTMPGDVWIMGGHRLMCGDSISPDDLQRLCAGQPVDLLLTDPPYNVAYEGGSKERLTIKNDDMDEAEYRQFLRDAFAAANAVMKPGAVFYIWHADGHGYPARGACRDAGWTVRQCLVWKKQAMVMSRQDYHWRHEPCLYGWKDGAGHLWAADRKQTTVLEFDRPSRNAVHPTMKPVALFEYLMLNNTKGSDLVLDSFAGSGTALIACQKHGRHARAIEIDPRYCDVIVTRWQDFTGGSATLEATGQTFEQVKAERIKDGCGEPLPGVNG